VRTVIYGDGAIPVERVEADLPVLEPGQEAMVTMHIQAKDGGARAGRCHAADGVLSAQDGVAAMKMDRGSSMYVFLATIVAATSGLLFGFDIAVINGALIFLRAQLHLSEVQTEMAASSLLFGCIFGASAAGWLSDRFGRRRVLMISGLLFAVSAIGAAIPRTLAEFAAARLAGGLAVGAASVLAPLYIAEVAPAKKPRQAGGAEPDDHRHRNSAFVPGELAAGLQRAKRMALDVRVRRRAGWRSSSRCSSCRKARAGWWRTIAARKR
jgi:hypothetical protein